MRPARYIYGSVNTDASSLVCWTNHYVSRAMEFYSILAAAVLLLAVVCAEDKEVESGGVNVEVKGRSGSVHLWRKLPNGNKTKALVMRFDALKELSANSDVVGKTGQVKHSFNSFASQDFIFSAVTDAAVPNSDGSPTASKTFSFSGQLKGLTSKLTVDIYLVKEDVNVTLGDELTSVTKGQVKITIKLEDWEWCAPCTVGNNNETGKYVDLVISLMSRGQAKKRAGKGKKGGKRARAGYDLGAGDGMELSNMVSIDIGVSVYNKSSSKSPKSEEVL